MCFLKKIKYLPETERKAKMLQKAEMKRHFGRNKKLGNSRVLSFRENSSIYRR